MQNSSLECKKVLTVTFHVERSSCVIGCLGDNHYQLIMRQYFVKFIEPWSISIFLILFLLKVSFEILSLKLKIIFYTNLGVFFLNCSSGTLVMPQLSISRILYLWYICPIFSILKMVFKKAFNEKYKSLCSFVCLRRIEIFHWNGGTYNIFQNYLVS